MPYNYFHFIVAFTVISMLLSACSKQDSTGIETPSYQAVSMLGDTLYAPDLDPETSQRYHSDLDAARANYMADPDDVENIIWYGRRAAYTGNYRKAISIYTRGIDKKPNDPSLYRHRGHRYITIRKFDKAVKDLEKAADLTDNREDRIEPDGQPNARNMPRSTLQTNIWYHLGLAYYLQGQFNSASESFEQCRQLSPNDDMLVASLYWLYMSLRRAGNDLKAGEVLHPVKTEMDIIENHNYHQLLLVFKGIFEADHLLKSAESDLENSTVGYGIGNWHFINGRKERAFTIFKELYSNGYWPAFGYIAAEAELARFSP